MLTLYRFQPPVLTPAAQAPGPSNHRIGTAEQQLSAIVPALGQRPAVIVPDASLRSLHLLRLDGAGQWKDQLAPVPIAAPVQRITPLPAGACVLMTNGATLLVKLRD